MRQSNIAAILLAAAALSACATIDVPSLQGGAPFALSASEADQAQIRRVFAEGAPDVIDRYARTKGDYDRNRSAPFWMDEVESDFESDVSGELLQELQRCATGSRPLDAIVRIDEIAWDERLSSLIDGRGFDAMDGVVELVDPAQGNRVVARYRILVGTNSGALLTRWGGRVSALAEEAGRNLCLEAFGRNPRGPAILNSTRG